MSSTGMEKGGRYSQNNMETFHLGDILKPWIHEAVETVLKDVSSSTTTFTYCDFGVADGGMASVIAKAVVDQVRASDSEKQISVVFADQPTNDFSPFFQKFQHDIAKTGDVFVSAIGRSFYAQCVPDNSVDLALTSSSLQWLDIDGETDEDIAQLVRKCG